jgi:hypothetical protein
MNATKIEDHVAALEAEVAQLKTQLNGLTSSKVPWWEAIAESFADDPAYEEAMRFGRKYRESRHRA